MMAPKATLGGEGYIDFPFEDRQGQGDLTMFSQATKLQALLSTNRLTVGKTDVLSVSTEKFRGFRLLTDAV